MAAEILGMDQPVTHLQLQEMLVNSEETAQRNAEQKLIRVKKSTETLEATVKELRAQVAEQHKRLTALEEQCQKIQVPEAPSQQEKGASKATQAKSKGSR